MGYYSLGNNTTGSNNTALGEGTLDANLTGSNNTALGSGTDVSISNLTNATAIGANALVSQSNSLILGDAASVGIGTSAPDEKLHVVGSIKMVDGNQAVNKILTSDANGVASWADAVEVSSINSSSFTFTDGNQAVNKILTSDANGVASWQKNSWEINGNNMTATVSGNVAIAKGSLLLTPAKELHVLGTIRTGFNVQSNSSGYMDITVDNTDAYINYKPYLFGGNGNIKIQNDGNTSIEIDNSGNVGIGETAPNEKLHVAGNAQIDGTINVNDNYTLPSTDGTAGQVLETDGNGTLSWTTPATPYIKTSVTQDITNISSNSTHYETFIVTGTSVGDVVQVSPGADLLGALVIGQVYVSAANTVRVKFRNTGSNGQNPANMTYYFVVIK